MPVTIEGADLYRIGEALRNAAISRATYFRWVRTGRVPDTRYKDRNGRRLFTAAELKSLQEVAQRLFESTKGDAGAPSAQITR